MAATATAHAPATRSNVRGGVACAFEGAASEFRVVGSSRATVGQAYDASRPLTIPLGAANPSRDSARPLGGLTASLDENGGQVRGAVGVDRLYFEYEIELGGGRRR